MNPDDPLRHFAIDLVIFDSKIVIDSVTCIPLVSLPPATITISDGPRAGESREIPYNEIPLFGRLTVHDQLEPHQTEPGKQTIALNFTVRRMLRCCWRSPPREEYAAQLFGPDIDRRSDGAIVFTGQDPRISWELRLRRGVLDHPQHRRRTDGGSGEAAASQPLRRRRENQSARLIGRPDRRCGSSEARRDGRQRRHGATAVTAGRRSRISRRQHGQSPRRRRAALRRRRG